MSDQTLSFDEFYNIANQFFKRLEHIQYDISRNSGYLARVEIEYLRKKLEYDMGRLEHFGNKVYSQNDEDGIIAEIFKRLSIHCGVFCEIGVENGLECNTHLLLKQGWTGCWIEASDHYCSEIATSFKKYINNSRLELINCRATPYNINDILHNVRLQPGREIDFLSIDIDGMDIYLLKSLQVKPAVICIEYNAKYPPNVNMVPVYREDYVWDGTDFMGASLSSISNVAFDLGYVLVGTNITGINAFYVRSDLVNDNFSLDLTAIDLYNPPRYYLTTDFFRTGFGHRAAVGDYLE